MVLAGRPAGEPRGRTGGLAHARLDAGGAMQEVAAVETAQRRVLVVEDERTIADALAARLRAEGFAVEMAADGPTAVAAALQNNIDIVLRRFAEYHDLEGAFGRRAMIERAKGILMERHSVDDDGAFDMLRQHSRATNRKLVDIATAVVDGHPLLPREAPELPD